MNIRRIVSLLREYCFPSGCALCGGNLVGADECWYGICEPCAKRLRGDRGDRCDRCGRPLISEQGRCMSCRNGETRSFDRIVTLYPYRGACRKLLGAYKFGRHPALGHFFAERIRETLEEFPDLRSGEEPLTLVPVPPRPGKVKKTGWDPVEHLAGLLEQGEAPPKRRSPERRSPERHSPPIPLRRCLKRLPSQSQKELDREHRRRNLLGKIVLRKKPPPAAVLLDDVITTGSTMDACAAALKAGGTQRVLGICLFYD
ncbi:MAG: ComF family protein [Treponema sp.]|jgi:predicted amidophosphoribosyltransferase|nr:ComF family protein [Treponema sp.]